MAMWACLAVVVFPPVIPLGLAAATAPDPNFVMLALIAAGITQLRMALAIF